MKTRSYRRNPWELSRAEWRVVVLCGVLGCLAEIGAVTGKAACTVKNQLLSARRKMHVQTNAQAVLKVERWKRGWQTARCAKDIT